MADHDGYGKYILELAAGPNVHLKSPYIDVDYKSGLPARIDGTIGTNIAVEIESRVAKQVRGAILDLIFHPYPKKLLVLLPVHMSNPETTRSQCSYILSKFIAPEDYRVVITSGHGGNFKSESDSLVLREAIEELVQSGAT